MGQRSKRFRVAMVRRGVAHRFCLFPFPLALYYLVASGYEPPEVLRLIATDRSQPYTHYERKRTRNRWRYYDERHGPVYKTTYVRREYAVGSDQGGVLQPIQQHSWDVTVVGAGPARHPQYPFHDAPVFLDPRVTDLFYLRPGWRGG